MTEERSTDPAPDVSVIVPVYEMAETLRETLAAIAEQTFARAGRVEVIVVDNGSTDRPADAVRDAGVRFAQEPVAGSYAARNRGLALARGQIVAFTDADCIPRPDWIERGVAGLRSTANVGFVGGRVEAVFQQPDTPTSIEVYDSIVAVPQERLVRSFGFAATANMFAFRSTFERVGLFDAGLRSGGDRLWGQAVIREGMSAVYCDDAVVHHRARRSLRQVVARARRVIGGRPVVIPRTSEMSVVRRLGWHAFVAPVSIWNQVRPARFGTRCAVLGVHVLVKCVQLGEKVRLRGGGEPVR
ncbi:MAG: glycosyltransferase family A protein [Planctomycetota bacterium]